MLIEDKKARPVIPCPNIFTPEVNALKVMQKKAVFEMREAALLESKKL